MYLLLLILLHPSITLSKSEVTFTDKTAEAQTITATTVPADAVVSWESDDTDVATVSGGVITPVGAGSCTITATITVDEVDYDADCDVTVGE